jgi:hypothetical protein
MKSTDDTENKKPVALNTIVSDNKTYPLEKKYLIKAS